MTAGQLHNSQRTLPCKCTLATYFINVLLALPCIYLQYLHVVSVSQIRLVKLGYVITPCTASWGNETCFCTCISMLYVVARVFNGTISTALSGIRFDEKCQDDSYAAYFKLQLLFLFTWRN
jgi:hypothetical protein